MGKIHALEIKMKKPQTALRERPAVIGPNSEQKLIRKPGDSPVTNSPRRKHIKFWMTRLKKKLARRDRQREQKLEARKRGGDGRELVSAQRSPKRSSSEGGYIR